MSLCTHSMVTWGPHDAMQSTDSHGSGEDLMLKLPKFRSLTLPCVVRSDHPVRKSQKEFRMEQDYGIACSTPPFAWSFEKPCCDTVEA